MTPHRTRIERLRSHRLTAPATSLHEAAAHMLAVQSQELWSGRWALAARTGGAPTRRAVDALFDNGEIVRSWTQRGTLHIIPARDLAWVLRATGERQLAGSAARYRQLGLGAEEFARAERAVRAALAGGNGLTRAELFAVFTHIGIDPAGQRGVHTIQNLALRGVVCQGPVVERAEGVPREQLFVLAEEHIPDSVVPDADPTVELFVRYVVGHGPVSAEDFAWWSGLPLGIARAVAAVPDARIERIEDGLFQAAEPPRRSRTAKVIALGSFEEYYISYTDRSVVCRPQHAAAVGPGKNGMVRAILLADGVIVGVWKQSTAAGRHTERPQAEVFDSADAVPAEEIDAALDRYARFIVG